MLQILIRFSMNIPLNLFQIKLYSYLIYIKSLWRLICSSWAQVDSNHRPRAYQARALTSWAMSPQAVSVTCNYDGDDGIRTHDPLLAGQVLSQLSYTPTYLFPLLYLPAHQKLNNKSSNSAPLSSSRDTWKRFSIERRWSSRTFRYGYLVTT